MGRGSVCCLLAASMLVLACGSEEEPKPSGAPMARRQVEPAEERSENQPPVIERAVLNPLRPLPGDTIEARLEASDPDGDPIQYELQWRHNGRVIRSDAHNSITPEGLKKGDAIELTVTASDGRDESAPVRVTATVGNQLPQIQAIFLTPEADVQPGQTVTAAPHGVDADGDPLEYEFEWLLNGHAVRGAKDATFDTSSLARGDRLQVRARATDGDEWSAEVESSVLQLANRPPKIAGLPAIESVNGGIQAQLQADDPDGDKSLRFRVVTGPRGLTVDPVSGRLSWKPEPGTVGTQPVEIAVADSLGAESALRFELNVSAPPDEKAAPAPPAKAKPKSDEEEDADE